jgi:DNA replication protein
LPKFDLSGLYDKLSYLLIDHEEEKSTNIYDVFESEFGRTISPMEYQIIGAWLDSGTSEETILLALKEATYNGVSNLRYIDKILSEWAKKGIKTANDVEKSRVNFKKKKEATSNDILNYDWLNDE